MATKNIALLTIRLQRVGRKNDPSFRIVLIDPRRPPRGGAFLEVLGSYNPRRGEPQFKAERIQYWLSKGAKLSGTVNNLLADAKIIKGPKVNVSPGVSKKDKAGAKEKALNQAKTAPAKQTEAKEGNNAQPS